MVEGLKVQTDKAAAAAQIKNLYRLFVEKDCTMVEVGAVAALLCVVVVGWGGGGGGGGWGEFAPFRLAVAELELAVAAFGLRVLLCGLSRCQTAACACAAC